VTQPLPDSIFFTCLLKRLLVALFLLIFGISSHSQLTDTKPKARLLTKFPFTTLSGGVIIVEAQIGNLPDTLNFILDTGSGGISLDSSLVDYLKLPKTASQRMLRGISGIKKISFVNDHTLRLPGIDVPHLDFHISDYEILTSVYGVRIDGIIGYSFFKQFIVKVDYDKSIIEVWSQGSIKYIKNGYILKPALGFIPVLDASVIDGVDCTSRFYFDTGAGLCLLLSEEFAKDSSILVKGKKVLNTQAEGLGGKKPMKLTTVKALRFGKYKFKKVPVHIFHDDYNVTSYPQLGGLIGNDLLRRFNLVINYAEKEIHMRPNTHFKDRFDYSYSGLGIYLVNGSILIEDVLENSPGEKAGLKPGDIIVAIDNAFNVGIQGYKDMLQRVGARLKILVMREGTPMLFTLKVKSFLSN
jgi:hypothetical protein